MCLGFPGQIISIKDDTAVVDFDGIQKQVNVSLISAVEGEYIMVHAGFAIQTMSDESAQEVFEIYESRN